MANTTELLLKQLLSNDALSGIASATGVSGNDVSNILQNALPTLLSGAQAQATNTNTSAGFAQALMSHAQKDTSNLASFLGGVDLTDGNKIVAHLTGNADTTAADVAKQAGVTKGAATSVLSAAAPLLMSLLGKQSNASSNNQSSVLSAVGSILGGNVGDIAKAAIAAYALSTIKNSLSGKQSGKKKKDKKDNIDLSDGIDLKDVIGIVGKIVK